MNITYLIGNGFDLNLGLDTTYDSFVKGYIVPNSKDAAFIKEFKSNIKQNLESWSAAELAFGQITSSFPNTSEGVQNFSDCHIDFCEHLAKYLQLQEKRIDFAKNRELIKSSFRNSLDAYDLGLREEQQYILANIADSINVGNIYNFINFNYTTTLDKFISFINTRETLGITQHRSMNFYNKIGSVYHVHGTTKKDMVFGVNDSSQIANVKLFEGQSAEYRDQIIKNLTNKMYEERTDEKVLEVLKDSDLIYIFGMSIGATDAMWWSRISQLLNNHPNLHVIIQALNVPKNDLIRVKFVQFENGIRNKFVNYSRLSENEKANIKPRIHVVGENIFSEFTDFVSKQNRLHNIQDSDKKKPDDKKSA